MPFVKYHKHEQLCLSIIWLCESSLLAKVPKYQIMLDFEILVSSYKKM